MESMKRKNKFIAFEGIDGSGKSTQISLLAQRLQKEGHAVYQTFEPTDGPIGRMIRDVFAHKMQADHRTIAGLFVADRLHHLLEPDEGVLHQLEQGNHVLMDRYLFSSYAYQGAHVDLEWVISANAESARLLLPDLYIYIDISPQVALERLREGREELELFETLENLRKVHTIYMKILKRFGEEQEILIVDGNQPADDLAEIIWVEVQKKIQEG